MIEDKPVAKSEVLVSKTRTGKNKYWVGRILIDKSGPKQFYLSSEYWQENGKHIFAAPYLVTPKNIGRANETTPEEQAYLEFEAWVKKQVDKGYAPEGEQSKVLPLPMLAQKFSERSHYIKFPAFVQPKLNGMRMLMDGKKAWSRGGKTIIPECIEHLMFDTKGYIVDGELILPGNVPLQRTMSATKKFDPKLSPTLQYWVYDIIAPALAFRQRSKELWKLTKKSPSDVIFVSTYEVGREEEVLPWHNNFIEKGFEGTMVRNADGLYTIGQRSNDLQKLKDFLDEEFEIVDVKEGDGKDKGLAIFICQTKAGKEFSCRPEGTDEHRTSLFKKRKSLIGKWLTIRFASYSDEGKPQHLVGVEVREAGEF